MIKKELLFVKKHNISYQVKNGKKLRHPPWIGNLLSLQYDKIMEKDIFPKKFMADIQKHFIFLKEEYSDLNNLEILEIACGSGSSADTLPPENSYTGIDISQGLLRIADKRFRKKGLKKTSFFISDAKDLPFEEEFFDVSICNLSLNFFIDNGKAINEIKRVLKQGGTFYCSIPVPEQKPEKSRISGTAYSAAELEKLFTASGFAFIPSEFKNGAIFYFRALKK